MPRGLQRDTTRELLLESPPKTYCEALERQNAIPAKPSDNHGPISPIGPCRCLHNCAPTGSGPRDARSRLAPDISIQFKG